MTGGPCESFWSPRPFPEINGVANTMRYLAEGLIARGHRLLLVRPSQPAREPPLEDPRLLQELVPGLPIPGYADLRFGLPVGRRLKRLMTRFTPDLLYIATQGPLGHAALGAARARGVPALTGFHTQFHQYSKHYGLGVLAGGIGTLLRRFHNRSQATLAPTQECAEQLIGQGFNNVHLFTRGVDTGLYRPQRRSSALRRSWGCKDDCLIALYVGRIAAEKNLALAVRAFDAIRQQRPNARFVLVGDGPELAQLKHRRSDFIFAGAKTGKDLACHYASGDLFLFPSLTETFGNVVAEAMASGLPVLAFDYAAARHYIRDGANGLLVPFGDEVQFVSAASRLATQPDRLSNIASAARSTAETLSWDQAIEQVEALFYATVRDSDAKPTTAASVT